MNLNTGKGGSLITNNGGSPLLVRWEPNKGGNLNTCKGGILITGNGGSPSLVTVGV